MIQFLSNSKLRFFAALSLIIFFGACARAPIKTSDQAMRPAAVWPKLDDDLSFLTLGDGLLENIRRLKETAEKTPERILVFGPKKIAASEYAQCLEYLYSVLQQDKTGSKFLKALREGFEPYEIYGRDKWGEVFMTSYYEPIIEGSKYPTQRFSRALLGVPNDLIGIDLGAFVRARPNLLTIKEIAAEQRSQTQILRGRLVKDQGMVVPYPSRSEIVASESVLNQASQLAWVDPIDAFFLEIQGSGIVHYEDGTEIAVGYAAQNGHPYVAIGKYLFDVISKDKMSIQAIENYLRSVSSVEANKIMNMNPSFVFFKELERGGVTSFGTELVVGRTIATDPAYFPKGALAFLEFDIPTFATASSSDPIGWKHTARFVLDQDSGGAIRGADRLDLYWGRGSIAKQSAGVMKNKGRLLYFAPKTELLERLVKNKK